MRPRKDPRSEILLAGKNKPGFSIIVIRIGHTGGGEKLPDLIDTAVNFRLGIHHLQAPPERPAPG